MDSYNRASENSVKISCNFWENLKELKGIYRIYAIIVEIDGIFSVILETFRKNSGKIEKIAEKVWRNLEIVSEWF